MADVRRRWLDSVVWVPLRAVEPLHEAGAAGTLGFESEFYGAGSIAVPLENRVDAEALDWDTVGISRSSEPYVEDGRYVPADVFADSRSSFEAIPLVLDQRGNRDEVAQWHLHQDFVIALGLKREGDVWVSIHDGYVEVARLHRRDSGGPSRLEVRAEYLKDYLRARGMALYVSSYRSRVRVVGPDENVGWLTTREDEEAGLDRWGGRAYAIHEGGMPFGEHAAVFHASRTDVPADEDVPTIGLPGSENVESRSWTVPDRGTKVIRIEGEFWRREWIEPAAASPRVRRDRIPSTVHFIVDAAGRAETAASLREGGRWLWFRPDVIPALAHRRGGSLGWYTRDTGGVRASPDYDVHFGVNAVGLVVAYAKDVALLPEWQQRIWAAHNVSPEGGISVELHASQVLAEPANTQAPEAYLEDGLEYLDSSTRSRFGVAVVRTFDGRRDLVARTHRFRALDRAGLFALAKDIARLTADSIDAATLQRVVAAPKGDRWGSLKSLERVLASISSETIARRTMGPLVAAYELRHGDAHLKGDLQEALDLAGIDSTLPSVHQGAQLLENCVNALWAAGRLMVVSTPPLPRGDS